MTASPVTCSEEEPRQEVSSLWATRLLDKEKRKKNKNVSPSAMAPQPSRVVRLQEEDPLFSSQDNGSLARQKRSYRLRRSGAFSASGAARP